MAYGRWNNIGGKTVTEYTGLGIQNLFDNRYMFDTQGIVR